MITKPGFVLRGSSQGGVVAGYVTTIPDLDPVNDP
jgi:hypothetical protein